MLMGNEIPKELPPIVLVPEDLPVKKHFRLNKWHIITVVLVAVILVQGFLYLSLNSRYDALNTDHRSLTSEHQNLTNDYDTLANQYSALQSEYNTLKGNYSSLQTSYSFLQSSYNSLQSSYSSYVSSYDTLRNQINQRTLQFGVTDFITPSDSSVQNIVYAITSGWSNHSNWSEFWDDVKIMYDWVVNNIEYRDDGLSPLLPVTPSGNIEYRQEMWQLPNETLNLKQGDCEDMAILLTAMIRFYDGDTYRDECIAIAGSMSGHMGVQMSVEGSSGESLLTILDPAGHYYTQTGYGDIDSKDISTEINNWLNSWKPILGSDARVQRVFSNHWDKSFSSTSEYTAWMYSR